MKRPRASLPVERRAPRQTRDFASIERRLGGAPGARMRDQVKRPSAAAFQRMLAKSVEERIDAALALTAFAKSLRRDLATER